MTDRNDVITETMNDIRDLVTAGGEGREAVEAIRDRLVAMAAHRDLFSLDTYPAPEGPDGPRSCLYRMAQDPDDRFALYANSARGAVSTPPHNHTTWAVVVGFEGQELNRFYRRTDDGGVEQTHEYMVEAGTGVAMVADDLHSIHIDGASLNFHCYGLALERLEHREFYDAKTHEWRIFPPSAEILEARSGLMSC